MEAPWPIEGMRITMVGAARTGRAVARFLTKRGAKVTLVDQAPLEQLGGLREEMEPLGVELRTGGHPPEAFSRADAIVLSPGVPAHLEVIEDARRRRIPVVSELELASWFLHQPMAAITGTNGKTTTTVLAGMALERCGRRTFVGGNIGQPLIEAVEAVPAPEVLVVEVSSFQLECTELFHPKVAAVLNIQEDHLDRHQTFDQYLRAKAKVFKNMARGDIGVINLDDPGALSACPHSPSWELWGFTAEGRPRAKARWEAPWMEIMLDGKTFRHKLVNPALMTRPLVLDLLAASLCCLALGCPLEDFCRAAEEFRGLEHRMEFVGEGGGIRFINDSKATNVSATAAALQGHREDVILIAGGKDKGLDFEPLREALRGKAKAVILMGEAAPRLREALSGMVPLEEAGDMAEAVRRAAGMASPGDTVLLSPACSSFDNYRDYQHRGEEFKRAVRALLRDLDRRDVAGH
jgi:UDP-N-acetylmuramoylalanine--D-glutamate ligase